MQVEQESMNKNAKKNTKTNIGLSKSDTSCRTVDFESEDKT